MTSDPELRRTPDPTVPQVATASDAPRPAMPGPADGGSASDDGVLALLGAPPERGRTDWLTARLSALAVEGRLPPGTLLPSERRLAAELGLSRGTVVRALDAARDRGLLTARRGAGRRLLAPPGRDRPVESLTARARAVPAGTIDLRATVLPPHPRLQEVAAEVTTGIAEDPAWGAVPADGLPELVEQVCAHYARRGLPTEPEQVLVTTGAVSGLHLALRALTRPGARVGTENPGYPNTARVIRAARRRLVPIDVAADHDAALLRAVSGGRLDAALLTPDFHNPTGHLVQVATREELLRAAARSGTALAIDETQVSMDWRPGGEVAPPTAGHGATTVLVGSTSKALWAGLRIGWVRTSAELAARISRIRLGVDLGAPPLEQRIAARLLAWEVGAGEGFAAGVGTSTVGGVAGSRVAGGLHAGAHIAATHAVAVASLRRDLPHWQWQEPDGGLSLWVTGTRLPADELEDAARERGVAITPGSLFSPSGTGWPHALRLPISGRPEELRQGLAVLAELDG